MIAYYRNRVNRLTHQNKKARYVRAFLFYPP